ncbi:hypothetical protein BDZ90DRAFT_233247 [Jaminaea rosea]|uniref:Uncharacterized protein n=1 Tax=Jaminaea rosea TaxID=1569628 RepID=A0A316UMV4_9BASI|nr:hypothetical protein BDZ90DRAFT_233247 [Jaminaea rosea]PWN26632.1 hypothetical protein BDZ90DRAFT_233247 [Jaminaea rosea]
MGLELTIMHDALTATPCGRDGWYLNASDQCEKNYFVICVRPTTPDNNDCFYMEADDDCQWPHTFEYGAAPTELEIWYKY